MKTYKLIVLIFCLIFITGCKDLMVTSFQVTGTPYVNQDNSAVVPVRVTIFNLAIESAEIFKVSTEFTGPDGNTYAVAFTVPGEPDIWYPYTDGPLGPFQSVTFSGHLTFYPSYHNMNVSIAAIADSCSGDEFMPPYCRVEECNEDNNYSTSISVFLP